MQKLIKKLEDLMVAITFAEAGEYDEARRQDGGTLPENGSDASLEPFKKDALESVKNKL